ncbi:MAG: Hsp20/alpha crystallin family protein, partial [Alphaproteobacteria bacterium]|nr:Hsp20/alpha crystallin family protein [Alphaproteobacteria bacterium]
MPAADIVETGDSYEIAIELPGMDAKSVEVELADG